MSSATTPEAIEREEREGQLFTLLTIPALFVTGLIAYQGHKAEHHYWNSLDPFFEWHPNLPMQSKGWPWRTKAYKNCTFFNFDCRKEAYKVALEKAKQQQKSAKH